MNAFVCVAIGGALGAVSRYAVSNMPLLTAMPHFRTLLVNVIGCMAIGVVWAVVEHWPVPKNVANVLIAGFLGGFTTYSSFSLESMRLLGDGRVGEALLYVSLTVIGCLGGCAAGLFGTGRLIKLLM